MCSSVVFDSLGTTFVAATDAWRSTDGGRNWTLLAGLQASVVTLLVDRENKVYAGTYEHGIFKSSDDGETWTPMNEGLTDFYDFYSVGALLQRPQGDLFASTFYGGVFHWSAGDGRWDSRSEGLPPPNYGSRALCADPVGNLFATAGDSGIYKSTDAGLTWIRSSNGIDETQFVIVADRSGILYSSGWSSVFKSTNKAIPGSG